jgi:hypothetical protein
MNKVKKGDICVVDVHYARYKNGDCVPLFKIVSVGQDNSGTYYYWGTALDNPLKSPGSVTSVRRIHEIFITVKKSEPSSIEDTYNDFTNQ